MIYVRVRCKKCTRVLAEFDSHPTDFEGEGAVKSCEKCALPGPGEFADVMSRKGVDEMPVLHVFEWSTMRPHVERAMATGKPVTLLVS